MFAEKRGVAGDYYLMTDEGDGHSYFLFRKGVSISMTGPLRGIGWDRHFVLVEDDREYWAAFPIDPLWDPVARDLAPNPELLSRLKRTIEVRSPREVWEHSAEFGSWFTRPFS